MISSKEREFFEHRFLDVIQQPLSVTDDIEGKYFYEIAQKISKIDDLDQVCQEMLAYLMCHYHTSIFCELIVCVNDVMSRVISDTLDIFEDVSVDMIELYHILNDQFTILSSYSTNSARKLNIDECPYKSRLQLMYLGYYSIDRKTAETFFEKSTNRKSKHISFDLNGLLK